MTKILIIEDNDRNQKLFKIIIDSLGFTSLIANNGEEGILIAKKELPDLILMDIQMPVMDGVEAFKVLQDDENTKKIPVIALTAYAMKGDKENLLNLGFNSYISKPIRIEDFKNRIVEFLK
ncbi:MAG: response regulator [Promethearchaeota archaeon]